MSQVRGNDAAHAPHAGADALLICRDLWREPRIRGTRRRDDLERTVLGPRESMPRNLRRSRGTNGVRRGQGACATLAQLRVRDPGDDFPIARLSAKGLSPDDVVAA